MPDAVADLVANAYDATKVLISLLCRRIEQARKDVATDVAEGA